MASLLSILKSFQLEASNATARNAAKALENGEEQTGGGAMVGPQNWACAA